MPRELNTPRTISIQARLNNLGKQLGISSNVAQKMRYSYFQDGFLTRLAHSPYQQNFVLGGALLLLKLVKSISQPRPTQDADFTCVGLLADATSISAVLKTIVQLPWNDEVSFEASEIRLKPLQQGTMSVLRARIPARLGNAQEVLMLDLVFGTALVPGPQLRPIPMTLDPSANVHLLTYPLESVLGGKVASMLQHEAGNTRYKDYFDLHAVATAQDLDGSTLEAALEALCQALGLIRDPTNVVFASPTFPTDPKQVTNWNTFVKSDGLDALAPSFGEAIAMVRALYGPVLAGAAAGHRWDHVLQQWV